MAVYPAWAGLPDFTDLAEDAGPAVVNISTVKVTKGNQGVNPMFQFKQKDGPWKDFFDQFENFFKGQGGPQPRKQTSLGSGFIISKDGYIVTNNHVVAGADEITVKLKNEEKELEAKIVGRDPDTDLALLKVEHKGDLPHLSFADSDKAKVGQWVMAIGNPFGLGHTVTAGIISAKGRVLGAGPFDDFLQTDASINPGNSGGPLINMDGKVVGINTAIIASGQGIGFAIPSSMAKKIIQQLKENKKVSRGWLGITFANVDANAAKALGLPEPQGALVSSVVKGDPADKGGVRPSDVIMGVNGQTIKDGSDLLKVIANMVPGEKATLTVWRGGKEKTLHVTLGERSAHLTQAKVDPQVDESASALGLALRSIDKESEARALGLEEPRGLLVLDVAPGSPAGNNDLRAGDVILEINQHPVNTMDEFRKIVDTEGKDKGAIMMLIKRRGQNLFRTIPLDEKKAE